MIRSILIILLCINSTWAGKSSLYTGKVTAPYAAGTTTGAQPNPNQPITGEAVLDPNYDYCDQACHHRKARENITLQVLYLKNKESFLESQPANPDDDAQVEALDKQKRELLKGFCGKAPLPTPTPDPAANKNPTKSPTPSLQPLSQDDESTEECVARYKRVNEFWYMKAKSALANSEKAELMLKCSKYDQAGNCLNEEGTAVQRFSNPSDPSAYRAEQMKMDQTPYFVKSGDMGKLHQAYGLSNVKDQTNSEWGTEYFNNFKPDKNDFIKFKKDPRDPSKRILDLDENGNPKIDEQAYQKALTAWSGSLRNDLNVTVSESGKTISQRRKEGDKKFETEFNGPSTGNKSLARQIYDDSRGDYIRQIQDLIDGTGRWDPKGKEIKGKTNNPVPTPAITYTGEEQVRPAPVNPTVKDRKDLLLYSDQIKIQKTPTKPTPANGVTPSNPGINQVQDRDSNTFIELEFH